MLDILGEFDLAIELPWDDRAQKDWETLHNGIPEDGLQVDRSDLTQSIRDQIDLAKTDMPEEAAYVSSGGVIAMYVAQKMANDVARKIFNRARTEGVSVEPVIAYGSYAEFKTDQVEDTVEEVVDRPELIKAHSSMFGWEFFVPASTYKSDAELLRDAAKLASRPDFCETRQYFYGWLKQMHEGEVDRQDAYEQMLKMLSEYTRMMRGSWWKTTAPLFAAKTLKVISPFAGLAGHIPGVAAGVVASGAAWAVEDLIPKKQMPDRLRPAAVLYDAWKFFGKA